MIGDRQTYVLPMSERLQAGKRSLLELRAENVCVCCIGKPTDISVSKYSTGNGRASRVTSLPYLSFSLNGRHNTLHMLCHTLSHTLLYVTVNCRISILYIIVCPPNGGVIVDNSNGNMTNTSIVIQYFVY